MSTRETYGLPLNPPPPSDIGTYSRSMLQHTKRQMEAINSTASLRSQGGQNASPPPLPNGIGPGSRNPSDYSYQT